MSKNLYKEKILEKMRMLNAELEVLSQILKETEQEKKEKPHGKTNTRNG